MACPTRRLLKMLFPTRTVRSVHVVLTVTFAICTFVLSMREISRFEKHSRRRHSSFDDKDVLKHTQKRRLTFPHINDSIINVSTTKVQEPHYTQTKNQNFKSIVWFNTPNWFTRFSSNSLFSGCDVSQCTMSYNHHDIPTADAVLVNGINISDSSPPPRRQEQMFVFFSLEPPVYMNISTKWQHAFNWTITYRRDSDVWRPYGELRRNRTKLSKKYFENILKKKTKAVAWFVSRCVSQSKRERYVRELKKHIQVDIYGRCGPYKCGSNCYQKLEQYHFFLAFENSLCVDYVTEKFFKTFKYDVVPVVRGGANYSSLFGDGFLINTADFRSVKKLGAYLSYLLTDEAEYLKILKEKQKYYVAFPRPWCDLCEKLHSAEKHSKRIDILSWVGERSCHSPSDLHASRF
ncbi:alpha-(1,3)-fucosyltransferase fut-1-like [Haliotis rubra]|uniref:alpha-(1,3)-fucosyltransferase fut-1-like n=1 Tax=Haliotis rubra TaxID=36100 RepID=UPI001EE62073|nr:alpha-(1,3)-fucosyltransferase fut-1-like [Haliotis rubra]XP_046542443.1 alpha-(1,3)-fucosyltransferase fut-1-like [Haliotis rubra]